MLRKVRNNFFVKLTFDVKSKHGSGHFWIQKVGISSSHQEYKEANWFYPYAT